MVGGWFSKGWHISFMEYGTITKNKNILKENMHDRKLEKQYIQYVPKL